MVRRGPAWEGRRRSGCEAPEIEENDELSGKGLKHCVRMDQPCADADEPMLRAKAKWLEDEEEMVDRSGPRPQKTPEDPRRPQKTPEAGACGWGRRLLRWGEARTGGCL
jgi:hypothetical protein